MAEVRIDSILVAEKPNFNVLRAQVKAVSDVYDTIFTARIDALEKSYKLLTPKQRKNYQCRLGAINSFAFDEEAFDIMEKSMDEGMTIMEEMMFMALMYGDNTHPLVDVDVSMEPSMGTPYDILYD